MILHSRMVVFATKTIFVVNQAHKTTTESSVARVNGASS